MKTVLLLVHDDAGQEARLQAALDLTRALDGHLDCLDVCVVPVLMDDCYAGAGVGVLLADEKAREGLNRTRLEARLAHEDVNWSWADATGQIAPALTEAAVLADLIVINRRLDVWPLPDMREIAGEVLLKSGRPILAVPEAARGIDLNGTALVAWDGSPAAEAALRAALPLLKLARDVVVFEVQDGSVRLSAEEAATYLSRHDIHATIECAPAVDERAASILLDRIGRGDCGYVVMGGFGHSRFTQALFGGVTRKMLTESPIPVFLAR
jgi:nucleotide-binding universal stress UspA family protein